MSEMEYDKVKIELDQVETDSHTKDLPLEKKCEILLKREFGEDYKVKSYCVNYTDSVHDEWYKDGYTILNGMIYKILNFHSDDCFDEMAEAEKCADGGIALKLYFYNGGACWSEIAEEALDKLEKTS